MDPVSPARRLSCDWRGWCALIAAFLLSGILGHDPWKQDETYSFGIVYHFLHSADWLVPINAGVPFLEKPPLYYWTATLFARASGDVLPLHDAARLASAFYMASAAFFVWKAAQVLFESDERPKEESWITLALFLGSLGMARHAHDLFTDTALVAGASIAFYGMALLTDRDGAWRRGGAWLGLGIGVAFLSKGFVVPAILGAATGVTLICVRPKLSLRSATRELLVTAGVAAPFLILWPLALFLAHPDYFHEWFWQNNVGRFLGFSVPRLGASNGTLYVLAAAMWFAFPSFPLAVAAMGTRWRRWRDPRILLPGSVATLGLAVLLASASARALYLLPLLPAFALLGTQALAQAQPRVLLAWNACWRALCLLGVALLVALWTLLRFPSVAALAPRMAAATGRYLPLGYEPPSFPLFNLFLALCLLGFFVHALRLKGDTPAATARIWLAGVAVLWGLFQALLLPWLDATRSYRPVLMQLEAVLRSPPYAGKCVADYRLGESIAPMAEYMLALPALPIVDPERSPCPLLLTSGSRSAPDPIGWRCVWSGSRLLDAKDEDLRLYARALK